MHTMLSTSVSLDCTKNGNLFSMPFTNGIHSGTNSLPLRSVVIAVLRLVFRHLRFECLESIDRSGPLSRARLQR